MTKRKRKRKFKNEDEERKYWASHDSANEIDWSKAKKVTLPKLRPSVKTISLRIPESMLEELKLLANKRDVPYQSLIKVFLSDRIRRELKKDAA
jgi:predicted DNA binding CopG/RHH family protein